MLDLWPMFRAFSWTRPPAWVAPSSRWCRQDISRPKSLCPAGIARLVSQRVLFLWLDSIFDCERKRVLWVSLTWSGVIIWGCVDGGSPRSRFRHDGSSSSPHREETATQRPSAFCMLKTFSGRNSSSETKWITATLLLSPKSSSNPMHWSLCHHVSV